MKIIFLVVITILVSSFYSNAQNKEDSNSTSKNEKPKKIRTIKVGGGDTPPSPPPPPPSDFGDYPAPPPPPPPSESRLNEREVYTFVEEMPMFPDSSCMLLIGNKTKSNCSNEKLLLYVYETLQYPASARAAGITGMVVVSFVIEADGQISTIKILRDPGGKLGEEGRRIINQMKVEKGPWIPGRQRGKAVPVKFNLPIRFKLD